MMYLRAHIYIYKDICTHIFTYIYIDIYNAYLCIYIYIYIYMNLIYMCVGVYIYIYVHNCVVENIENLRTTQENRHSTSQQECSRTDNALSKASPMHALIVQDCVHCLCLLCNWKSCYVCKDWDTTLAMRANCNCFVEREAVWKKTVGVNPQQSLVWHHLWKYRSG